MPMTACPRVGAGEGQRAVRVPPMFGRGGLSVIIRAVVRVVVMRVQSLAVMMIGIGRAVVVMLGEIAARCGGAVLLSRGEMRVAMLAVGVLVDDE